MISFNYDGRRFKSIQSSHNGDVDSATSFQYRQEGTLVWGTYSGGAIRFGTLVALADDEGNLDMRYQHVNHLGVLMTGECQSTPEMLSDGRLRLRERWRWTSGDRSEGESVIEEVLDEGAQ